MKEKGDSPLASVILCTFNRKHLVTRAIDSVFEQTYKNWELIIVDDGSNDGSEKVLLPLSKKDNRIIYIRQYNKGLAYSRNVGLKISLGKYLSFIDSDDEYLPDHLDRRISYLESYKQVGAVFGGIKIFGPRSKHFVPDVNHPGKKIHLSRCHIAGTLVARKGCLMAVRGFRDITFSEDYDLIKRLMKRFKVMKIRYPTYVYHVDSDNRLCDLFQTEGIKGILKYRSSTLSANLENY